MPTVITHAVAALALGPAVAEPRTPARVWALGAICAMLPDADVIAFRFGIPYGHMLGHRGLTHSLLFAAFLATLVTVVAFPRGAGRMSRRRLWMFVFLATASHGALDALTDGGRGVAFLAPFDATRYFFPWTPIEVSPITVRRFLSQGGRDVIASELRWVWIPAAAFAAAASTVRRVARGRRSRGSDSS